MSTITLAKIYEKQGYYDDALSIYTKLYRQNPKNPELIRAIKRLQGPHAKRVAFFTNMYKREEFDKFERWLVKPWS